MKEVALLFHNKRTLLGIGLLTGLIYSSFNIAENSGKLKKISTFDSGIQTCYSRVNQTYTAKLLEDKGSQYLTQNFQALTEECFAESMMNLDENFKNQLSSVEKKLSNLASNVHWFHEDLISPNSKATLSGGEGRDIGSRFEKIENTKDEILEEAETYKTKISNDLNNQKTIFYVAASLLAVVMLLEYLAGARKKISNNAREIEADKELLDQGGVHSVKLGEIIRLALEQNDLKSCAKLFNNYYVHTTFEKSIKQKNKASIDSLITPAIVTTSSTTTSMKSNEIVSNETIDKIWNDDTIGIVADTNENNSYTLNLDTYTTKVIDALAEKLFSQGVQVDVNIDDKINVKGQDEILEQVLYHAINFAVNSTSKGTQNKSVRVAAIKLGDVVALDISSNGSGFETNKLKDIASIDLDLQIAQSLLSEIEGKMQVDNKLSQAGDVVGPRIKLILKGASTVSTSKLVDLKKGSKKDILSQLQSSSAIN